MRKRKKGFTLVEIVVVLVILAVLAASLIPSLTGLVGKAKSGICKSTSGQIRRFYMAGAAAEMYSLTEAQAHACLAKAVELAELRPDGDGAYICPDGGRCEVEYANDYKQIACIVCSLHGLVSGVASTYTLDQIGESFGDAVDELGSELPNRDLFSTASDPALIELVLSTLPEGMRDSLADKVWTLKYMNYWNSYELIVFDGSVDELPAVGTKTPVTVYSSVSEPHVYEGKRYVASRRVNGAQVKILEPVNY